MHTSRGSINSVEPETAIWGIKHYYIWTTRERVLFSHEMQRVMQQTLPSLPCHVLRVMQRTLLSLYHAMFSRVMQRTLLFLPCHVLRLMQQTYTISIPCHVLPCDATNTTISSMPRSLASFSSLFTSPSLWISRRLGFCLSHHSRHLSFSPSLSSSIIC